MTFSELKKNDHTVILVGDLHNSSIQDINSSHTNLFGIGILNLEKKAPFGGLHRKSKCYFELSQQTYDQINSASLPQGATVAATFDILAQVSATQKKSSVTPTVCQLIPFEPRGVESDYLAGALDFLPKILENRDLIQKFKFSDPDLVDEFKKNGTPTFGAVLAYLESHLRTIETMRNQWKEPQGEYQEFDSQLKKLHITYKKIKKIFSKHRDHYLHSALIKALVPNQSLSDLRKLLENDFDFAFADSAFLNRVLQDEIENPKSLTALFTGNGHTAAVRASLIRLGYQVKQEVMPIEPDGTIQTEHLYRVLTGQYSPVPTILESLAEFHNLDGKLSDIHTDARAQETSACTWSVIGSTCAAVGCGLLSYYWLF